VVELRLTVPFSGLLALRSWTPTCVAVGDGGEDVAADVVAHRLLAAGLHHHLEQIEALPSPLQSVLLKTIDTFLGNAAFRAARR